MCVAIVGKDCVSRTELPCALEFFGDDIDCDHPCRAGHSCTLDTVQPDPAGTDDDDIAARPYPCGVGRCPESGNDAARQQAGHVQLDVGRNLLDLALIDNHPFRESRRADTLFNRGAFALTHPQRAGFHPVERSLAGDRVPVATGPA